MIILVLMRVDVCLITSLHQDDEVIPDCPWGIISIKPQVLVFVINLFSFWIIQSLYTDTDTHTHNLTHKHTHTQTHSHTHTLTHTHTHTHTFTQQDEPDEIPMQPITCMRNALGREEGGSGVPLVREKYLESVKYWEEHALVMMT